MARLLIHFSAIIKEGKDYQDSIEQNRRREERENEYYRKVELVIEKRFDEWLQNMRKPPSASREALILGAKDADCRIDLYVRAVEITEAANLAKRTLAATVFASTATYKNRLKDKEDLENSRGFSEEGSQDIDIHTRPNIDGKTTRICRGYK